MIPNRLLPLTAVHKRLSNQLFSGVTFPFTETLTWEPSQNANVIIEGSGIPSSVTISVTGTINGLTVTEALALLSTVNQVRSSNRWEYISQISCPTSISGSVSAHGTYSNGQPALVTSTISSSLKGRKRASRLPNTIESAAGQQLLERWYFYTNDYANIQPSDILTIESIDYEVESIEQVYAGSNIVHHGRAFLKRFN